MMKTVSFVLMVIGVVIGVVDGGAAASDGEARLNAARRVVMLEDHAKLLTISHEETAAAFADMIAATIPDAPDGFAEIVHEIWSGILVETQGTYLEAVVQAYAEAFSVSDLEAITAFYESPQGAAYVRKLPRLTRTLSRETVKWQSEAMPLMMQRLSERFDLPTDN